MQFQRDRPNRGHRLVGFGQYATIVWIVFICNSIVPQVLWVRSLRRHPAVLLVVSLLVLVGMWFERYVIVITLTREYMPGMWGRYAPTVWDWATFIGTFGLFFTFFMLFVRYVPMISTRCEPSSCAGRIPSSGRTMCRRRSRASRRPSASKPGRYMTSERGVMLGALPTSPSM